MQQTRVSDVSSGQSKKNHTHGRRTGLETKETLTKIIASVWCLSSCKVPEVKFEECFSIH